MRKKTLKNRILSECVALLVYPIILYFCLNSEDYAIQFMAITPAFGLIAHIVFLKMRLDEVRKEEER